MRPTSGRCLTPFACLEPAVADRENDHPAFGSTALMVLATIGNRFKLEASGAFAPSVRMRNKTAYGKDAEAAPHHVSTRKPTKAEMSSNAQSTA